MEGRRAQPAKVVLKQTDKNEIKPEKPRGGLPCENKAVTRHVWDAKRSRGTFDLLFCGSDLCVVHLFRVELLAVRLSRIFISLPW